MNAGGGSAPPAFASAGTTVKFSSNEAGQDQVALAFSALRAELPSVS